MNNRVEIRKLLTRALLLNSLFGVSHQIQCALVNEQIEALRNNGFQRNVADEPENGEGA